MDRQWLPAATDSRQLGIDDPTSQDVRVRPVIAQSLPDVPNGPRIPLRLLRIVLTAVFAHIGRLNLDAMVSNTIHLEEINDGFEAMKDGRVARTLISFA